MKTIQELMSYQCQTCLSHESVEVVCERMRADGLNSLVVLDNRSTVVGTVAYLDACLASLSLDKLQADIKVIEIMSSHTLTVNTNDNETLALNLMRQFQTNVLPVVDQENRLKGSIRFITLARRMVSFKKQFKLMLAKPYEPELV